MQEITDIDPKYKYVKGKHRKDTVVVVTKVKKQNLKNLFLISKEDVLFVINFHFQKFNIL